MSAPRISLAVFDASPGADLVETHVSTIVFDGDVVHKRKKPVRFAFVDLTTPARREEIWCREVQLNRRFSRDVYLGVEEVVDDEGVVVDHAVLMRRMPAGRRLASMVRQGGDVSRCLRAVARAMAACHAEAIKSNEISSPATPAALHELWAQNMREIGPFVPVPLDGAQVARVSELAHRYLDGRSTLLMERIAHGRVVDGHGDLLADDIFCLDDGPRILDALVRRPVALGRCPLRRRVPRHGSRAPRPARPGVEVPRLVRGVRRRDASGFARAPLRGLPGACAVEDLLPAGVGGRGVRVPRPVPASPPRRARPARRDRRTAWHRQDLARRGTGP